MRKNLVDSKIQKPSVYSPNFIFREGLVERLGDRQKHLLVLHATVGYGKTVLLTHYAQETPDTCAWYHLNDTDNDIAVFMQYLCSSVKKCLPDFDFDPDVFTPFLQEREAVKTMAHIFVARMEEAVRSASQDLILIFDDFQAIEENEEIQQIIQLILNNTTEKIRLILATKGSLPPFYFRYFLQDSADLITQRDLCFAEEEVQALTQRVLGEKDCSELAGAIWEKAEGWPAGVMFANLYLKQQRQWSKDPELDTVYAKSAVNTYFMFEIFKKLPYRIQQFLTYTSPLEFLNSDVCNDVLRIDNAQSILDYLERENLFVIKVGQSERTFRYHSLFKDFLTTQLREEIRRDILNRAAEHYLHTENKEQAVEYALQGENWDLAQYALETVGRDLLEQGRLITLTRWLSELEKAPAPMTPKNLLLAGCYCSRSGQIQKAEGYLDKALTLFISSMDEWGYIHCMLEKARIARHQVSLEESNRLIEEVLPRLQVRYDSWRYTVVGERLYNFIFLGRYREVLAICSEMILNARREGNQKAEGFFIRFSVIVYFYLGKYQKGLKLYTHLLEWKWFEREGENTFSVEAYVAFMYLCTGQKEKALETIRKELGLRTQGHKGEDMWLVYLFQAYISFILAQGEGLDARERKSLSQEAERSIHMAQRYVSAFRADHVFVQAVQMAQEIILFNPLEGTLWEIAERIVQDEGKAVPLARDFALSSLAILFYNEGEGDEVEKLARAFLAKTEWETPFAACARLVLALVCQREGLEEEGVAALKQAQEYSNENGLDWSLLPAQVKRDVREFLDSKGNGSVGKVRVNCFGDFRVFLPDEGGEIKWRTKKAQVLFAYLFHLQGRPVDRDVLLLQLWPEADKKSATTLLHTTLYSIRKSFAAYQLEGVIEYQKRKYSMKMAWVHSDLEEMDQLCQALEQGDKAFICGRRDVLKCYKGGYLDGVDGSFSETQRIYYEKMFLELCRILAEDAMLAGDYDGAVDYLDKAITIDSYDESFYLMLMECFQASGEVRRAKHYYDRMVRILKEDLDVKPEEKITVAYRNCLAEGTWRKKVTAL